jgi:uncharacterized low-complexity protein
MKKHPLVAGIALASTVLASQALQAGQNPFVHNALQAGFSQVMDKAEGKCGEGKCGESLGTGGNITPGTGGGEVGTIGNGEDAGSDGSKKMPEGKCGEGKCGEGKCGENAK